MIINIRQSIFETNSSSMHSIAIKKEHHKIKPGEEQEDFFLYKGKVGISYDDICFGRTPFRCLATLFTKSLYVIAEDYSNREEVYSIIRKFYPDFIEFDYQFSRSGYPDIGLIEESCNVYGFIKRHNITLEDFLTDNAYVIFVDGDEYCVLNNMIRHGIIKKENFEEIEYEDTIY